MPRVAVVDIGTNSTRLLVADVTVDGIVELERRSIVTRLGEGLEAFNREWGVRGLARGADVVVLSDGWDRGDPDELAEQMQRLSRVTHRLIWVNPLKVSPGYARNYLIPHDLAVEPTPNNVKKIEARRKEIEKQEREKREQQAAMIARLEGVEVTLERRANEQGHLFGSVTATDIAKALQAQGTGRLFGPGTSTRDIVEYIRQWKRGVAADA